MKQPQTDTKEIQDSRKITHCELYKWPYWQKGTSTNQNLFQKIVQKILRDFDWWVSCFVFGRINAFRAI